MEQQRTEARDRQLRAALTTSADTPGDVRTLAALAASRVAARSLLTDLDTLRSAQRDEVDAARARFTKARRAEQGIERLADAFHDRERARRDAAEQAVLDEVALRSTADDYPAPDAPEETP
jgi:flagellar FliJ protein